MTDRSGAVRAFIRYGWFTVGVTLLVILWGAVVRATGSGAGCGSHWPLCNGTIVPLSPTTATVIEFVHRVTSGAVMLMAVGLVAMARRAFPEGHPVRQWAWTSLVFMLIEALIGAGIVLLELVGENASMARALYVGGHLVNTLLLVGAQTTTMWWATSDATARAPRTANPRTREFAMAPSAEHSAPSTAHRAPSTLPLWLCLVGMLLVAATGAIVALGDTLFPHASLAEGFAADFDPAAHVLIRLRIWHPVLAVILAASILWLTRMSPVFEGPEQARARALVIAAVLVQSGLGLANLLLLAPLVLQMAHLLVSNLLWIPLVWAYRTAEMRR